MIRAAHLKCCCCSAHGPEGCRGADALIEVFKDKNLELLLKYSRVIFVESSLKAIKMLISALPCIRHLLFAFFLSHIKFPDIRSVMRKHYFKGILKCSLYKESFL